MPGVLDSRVDFLVRFLPFNVLERVPAPVVLLRHILERVPVLDIMGRPTEALDVALGLLAVDALTKLLLWTFWRNSLLFTFWRGSPTVSLTDMAIQSTGVDGGGSTSVRPFGSTEQHQMEMGGYKTAVNGCRRPSIALTSTKMMIIISILGIQVQQVV